MLLQCLRRRAFVLGATGMLCLAIAGCQRTHVVPVAQLSSAAAQGENLAPIELDRVVFNLERGQQIGAYRGGGGWTGCGPDLASDPIHWNNGKVNARDEELLDIFYREMRSAHYDVVGDPNALFGNFTDAQRHAEFLVAGRVDTISMDICDEVSGWDGRPLGKQSGTTVVSVIWQVFSTLDEKVILETQTSGSAELKDGVPDGEVVLLVHAFAAAVHNLGGDPRFHDVLVRKNVSVAASKPAAPLDGWGTVATHPALSLPATAPFTGSIGANMSRVEAAVVTVITGSGHGSGFFIAPNLILTNHHVALNADRLKVRLINGTEVLATTLRSDKQRDVALLQIDGGEFTPLPIRLKPVALTEEVYAIGSPFDESLAGSVTRGIVSQIQHDEHGMELIQADATIQHGSSGGPLLDAQGNVVGISQSAWTDGTEQSAGINFFVPIADALQKLNLVPQ